MPRRTNKRERGGIHPHYESIYRVATPLPRDPRQREAYFKQAEEAALLWLHKIATKDGYQVIGDSLAISQREVQGLVMIVVEADVRQARHQEKKSNDRNRARRQAR